MSLNKLSSEVTLYGGAVAAIFGGINLLQWCAIIGALVAIAGFIWGRIDARAKKKRDDAADKLAMEAADRAVIEHDLLMRIQQRELERLSK